MKECDSFFRKGKQWMHFSKPVEIISAYECSRVIGALEQADKYARKGMYCAGCIAYEAASAFDKAMKTKKPVSHTPLVMIGVHEAPRLLEKLPFAPLPAQTGGWNALAGRDDYQHAFDAIMENIREGNTYQINYTFPVEAEFQGDTGEWFAALYNSQPSGKAAFLRFAETHIMSLSPELFFRLENGKLTTSPMKGTRRRGLYYSQDVRLRDELPECPKERAENVMIVDMLRNDLGRVSEVGSIEVEELFKVEKYPTVWQMISTISSRTSARVPEILAAIFPCGSVTGAPKVRSMQIISEIERYSRGVYCGAVGWWTADEAFFNVPIRTAAADTKTKTIRYNVGSGITFDSKPESEYNECLVKARMLSGVCRDDFELLESLLLENGEYFLFDRHIKRIMESARYFDFDIDECRVRKTLLNAPQLRSGSKESFKVRLTAKKNGSLNVDAVEVKATQGPVKIVIAEKPIDENNVFFYHKTTNRKCYDDLKSRAENVFDTILYNSKGMVTESAIANVVARIGGELATPPVSCGLLAGTFREYLIESGQVKERQFTIGQLKNSPEIRLVNSVRKWMVGELITP